MKVKCRCCGKSFEMEKTAPPFCSERCRLMDLGAWASQKYRIAGARADDKESQRKESQDE